MADLLTTFPDINKLTEGLNRGLREGGLVSGELAVIERQPNDYASTFPSEIVTCQCSDGTTLRLLCKYSAKHDHNCYGHRGGVAYEAAIYHQVLQSVELTTPTFYGSTTDAETGWNWLIIEYLEGAIRAGKHDTAEGIVEAARWLGRFHSLNEARVGDGALAFVNRYDATYYEGWLQRTKEFSIPLHQELPWLPSCLSGLDNFIPILLAQPLTVTHGEYYSSNILFRDGVACPVDWESAAIAPGEIDLASLTESWPVEVANQCEVAYKKARWPHGAPVDFERTLNAGRIYFLLRWLGDRPHWATSKANVWRFEALRSTVEKVER